MQPLSEAEQLSEQDADSKGSSLERMLRVLDLFTEASPIWAVDEMGAALFRALAGCACQAWRGRGVIDEQLPGTGIAQQSVGAKEQPFECGLVGDTGDDDLGSVRPVGA